MAGTKSLDTYTRVKWNEPWRRARLVQRATTHLGEEVSLWRWELLIALGGMLVVFIVFLLFLG